MAVHLFLPIRLRFLISPSIYSLGKNLFVMFCEQVKRAVQVNAVFVLDDGADVVIAVSGRLLDAVRVYVLAINVSQI